MDLITSAIIYENKKVLLIKRAREPFKGHWSFVGGKGAFRKANNPEEAVKLEVKYDLGCEFEPVFYTYRYSDLVSPAITLFFKGKIKGGIKSNKESVLEYKWFDFDEAQKLEHAFGHKKVVEKFFKDTFGMI